MKLRNKIILELLKKGFYFKEVGIESKIVILTKFRLSKYTLCISPFFIRQYINSKCRKYISVNKYDFKQIIKECIKE